MDRKIKLLVVASAVTVMASGCSGYRNGSSQGYDGGSNEGAISGGGATQSADSNQVSRGGLFSQQRARTCTPCSANKSVVPKSTYTYKPAPKSTYRPAPKPAAGQHSQQYYIDRWNRQQAQQGQKPRPKPAQNYTGYGTGNYNSNAGTSSTNYYDYSSAGKTSPAPAPAPNVSASNKSIYTGSYQQPTYKPYQPTTYSGGSAATTNTTNTYSGGSTTVASGGSSYTVKKGDTVFEVMRQTGVYWKDIISMNNLVAPAYTITPGQRLRLK